MIQKLTGEEKFINTKSQFVVREFWQYGFSDLNLNIIRGVLAEFLIEKALNNSTGVRNPWDDHDVLYRNIKIEVKCSAYIQSWEQSRPSKIQWSGLYAHSVYHNKRGLEKILKSDIYIFCYNNNKDIENFNILDLSQWIFYIVKRNEVEELVTKSGVITLKKLENTVIEPLVFDKIKLS